MTPSPYPNNAVFVIICELPRYSMGRITPFRQLYQETILELQMELKAALVDLGHKSAFDLLLKEAWNPEVATMGNSTLPTVIERHVDHTPQETHRNFSSRERLGTQFIAFLIINDVRSLLPDPVKANAPT